MTAPPRPDGPATDAAGLGHPPEPLVVTVDEAGTPIGTAPRLAAHRAGGIRHLAVSVVLRDPEGRVLLQQRATAKALFGGRWSNTACTHPLPHEPPADAAHRRLREELGVSAALTRAGQFAYEALDPDSGLSENELDHVFVGLLSRDPVPDPAEVAAVRWIDPTALAEEIEAAPERFTPWLGSVLAVAALVP